MEVKSCREIEKICIYEYSTAKDFLLDNKKEDILILDIEMQDMSGVELKNKFRAAMLSYFVIDFLDMLIWSVYKEYSYRLLLLFNNTFVVSFFDAILIF